jgi:anthranilate phosphoribosyltransferase
MQSFIKEVGRGKKGAKDLLLHDAKRAAAAIADGGATPAQIGGFFMAERMKGESVEELLGFIEALRERSIRVATNRLGMLDCAGPYDGRGKSFAATIPVAAVLASHGVPAVLHGAPTLPPKFGVSLLEILQALGVSTDAPEKTLESAGVAFLNTEQLCPPLEQLRPIREQLGVRTLLNTAEKFLNLAGAEWLVAGVFHTSAMEKAAELMMRLNYRRGMVVQGIDGSEDIPVTRPSACYIVQGDTYEKHVIDPREYDLHAALEAERMSPQEQAAAIASVLNGEPSAYRNMVLLNSALRLWFVERAASVAEGVDMAREAIDSGRARTIFDGLSTR